MNGSAIHPPWVPARGLSAQLVRTGGVSEGRARCAKGEKHVERLDLHAELCLRPICPLQYESFGSSSSQAPQIFIIYR